MARRKKWKRKKKRYRASKSLSPYTGRYMGAFPENKVVNLRYVDIISLNPAAISVSEYIFRANSVHDPDYSGGGHQPLGYDQWTPFYNHYVVIGARISCQFIYSSGASPTGIIYGVYLRDDATTMTTGQEIMEQQLGKYRVAAASSLSSPSVTTLTNNFSAKKFFNITDIKDNRDNLGAIVTTSPTDGAFFHVWASTLDGTDLGDVDVVVTMNFIVSFSEPNNLAQS